MDSIAKYLGLHRFRPLFIDRLGWDLAAGVDELTLGEQTVVIKTIAQKRGFRVVHCETNRVTLADRGLLRKVQRRLGTHVIWRLTGIAHASTGFDKSAAPLSFYRQQFCQTFCQNRVGRLGFVKN